ncbi:ricin-type beta-trefoil lectin domain protein [Streptomyces roseirectus]|uniref:Ricin-type beta-trefoil lectin domain protein n=1 Tax=Streptomyces roseirectus TaxID=2768066 RepID=A0A7H0INW9_9ACTN|nr:ricin-type beta-trefoil lectin domain protein [Streptomyces roseirectus]QNP74485.1 ricin-type beta-trefoil lectin domain protein [Streptomyces roseirectus]
MLSAELKSWGAAEPALQPVGELLDRHWEAAFRYARLCTDTERAAGMLTTAAFTRLFGESSRHDGPTSAWRPHLLVTVRRIAAEWTTDSRRDLLHPGLRVDDADLLAARLLPPPNRRLLSRSFQRLPQTSRCLLWHVEVEAEPLSEPAALLGLDAEAARLELLRSRDRLREELLQSHRELAADEECHRYDRLLEATSRRGDAMDADLRGHLDRCRHCAHTADQLTCFTATERDTLGTALAEGTLGWAAHAYRDARTRAPEPAHPREQPEPPGTELVPVVPGSSVRAARKAARRARRRNLAVAVLTVSGLTVLPLAWWAASGSDGGTTQAAGSAETPRPGTDTGAGGPSWAGTGATAQGTLRGRLHNVFSGQCVAVDGGKAVPGADAVLATCSSVASQQWSYDTGGLLRNGLAPELCLDSHLGYAVELTPCADAKTDEANVRYDFTLQGTLVPRWDQDLALAPAATDGSGALVAKSRADSAAQRWVIDTSKPDLQMQIVNWDTARTPSETPAAPKKAAPPAPKPTPTPTPPRKAAPKPSPTPTPMPSMPTGCSPYNPYACGGSGGGYPGGYPGGWGGYGGYGYGGYGRP